MQTALIGLIIMQITLVTDSLTTATVLFKFRDYLHRLLGLAPFSNMAEKRNF